jgi:general secretion pathway protein F
MISIGEQSSKLGPMLIRAAAIHEQQIQRAVDRLVAVLTPALTLTIAGVVGGLLLSVMAALSSLNDLAVR